MRTIWNYIFDLLFPPRASDSAVRLLTEEMLQTISNGGSLPYADKRVQALVWELKYYASPHALHLAAGVLGERILAIASDELGKPLLVAVPMHKTRLKQRTHDHTEVLCKATLLYAGNSVTYIPGVLERIVDTPTQQGLPRAKRLTNVAHSMRATSPSAVAGRVCIVVDDVTTTGATLEEAKRALLEAGASTVHTLALAQ
jgi:predicted amidophosphoribosyltransferase